MKRIISLILCIILAVIIPCTAYAEGDGNMDGGGGGMGGGTGSNIWHDGEDGVRVTVIRAKDGKPVSVPFDLTNRNENNVYIHFGMRSKLHYRNGATLVPHFETGSYKYTKPQKPMPKIISGGGNANIAAIKQYFCSKETVERLASIIHVSYQTLTNGDYMLLIEPIAYFTF